MEKRPEKKPKNLATISFETPGGPFLKTIYFNRFGLESLGANKILYFGLMRADGQLLEGCTCVISDSYLNEMKSSWMEYLGKIGELPSDDVDFEWKPPISKIDGVFFTNIAQVARSGNLGEFRFYSYSMGFVWDKRRTSTEREEKVVPQPQGLLVSDLNLHIAIIVKLFEAP